MQKAISTPFAILVVGIIAVIGFTILYSYQYIWTSEKEISLFQKDRSELANRYEEVGFWGDKCSIEYPSTWKIGHDKTTDTTYLTPKEKNIPEDIWVTINCFPKEKGYIDDKGGENLLPLCQKDGFTLSHESKFEAVQSKEYCILSPNGEKIGIVQFQIRNGRQGMGNYISESEVKSEMEDFNNMLSTFEILDRRIIKLGEEKKYINDDYGFSFKYPSSFGDLKENKEFLYEIGLNRGNALFRARSVDQALTVSVVPMDKFRFMNTGGSVISYNQEKNKCIGNTSESFEKDNNFYFQGAKGCYLLEGDAGGGFVGYAVPDKANERIIEIAIVYSLIESDAEAVKKDLDNIISTIDLLEPRSSAKIEPKKEGARADFSIAVSNTLGKFPKTVDYGTENVELLSFNLRVGSAEDIELSGIAIEFYSKFYGEQLDRFAIRNMRLIDEEGNIYSRADALSSFQETAIDKSWGYTTTYVWFKGKDILPKGTTKTFKLLVNIPSDSSLRAIRAILPSWKGSPESTFGKGIGAHFKAIGVESREAPEIRGDARGVAYLKPVNNIGSITISSEESFKPVYSRTSKNVVLSKIYLITGKEEDIEVSKIAMRLTNFIPGQFRNLKLIQEDGSQYGNTIQNPPEISHKPNLVFNDRLVLKADNMLLFKLIGDVSIPSSQMSEYGTQLQRELVIYLLTPQNYSDWITAKGITSGKDVFVSGAVDTWLQFNN